MSNVMLATLFNNCLHGTMLLGSCSQLVVKYGSSEVILLDEFCHYFDLMSDYFKIPILDFSHNFKFRSLYFLLLYQYRVTISLFT